MHGFAAERRDDRCWCSRPRGGSRLIRDFRATGRDGADRGDASERTPWFWYSSVPVDANAKRKQAEAVRKQLSVRVVSMGFTRTKPTFWTRGDELIVQFVHLHLMTFAAGFRVHFGIRVLNDTFPAPVLNGPMSEGTWAQAGRKYVFDFSKTHESVVHCVDELASYIADVGVPWFERFGSADSALAPDGPLTQESRDRLRRALSGDLDGAAIAASRAMLGIST